MTINIQKSIQVACCAKAALVVLGMLITSAVHAATLIVDDTNDPGAMDDGKCSLREAITAINNGAEDADDCLNTSVNGFGTSDEIQFDAVLSGAEIDLNGTELPQIAVGLQITGPVALDPSGITIDGENNSRIFNIDGAPTMSLSNLTLKRGRTTADNEDGGALRSVNTPLLSLADVIITNSHTEGLQSRGGGVFVVDGNVNLLRTTLSGNSTGGNGAPGGGLYMTAGDLTANQGLFVGNSTTGFDSDGGGLYIANGNEANIDNSEIADNFTTGDQSTGGGLSRFSGGVTLDNCEVTGNHTEGDNAGGGGLHVIDGHITLRLDTLVSGNSTEGMDAHGGGIFAENAGLSLTEPAATVSGNSTSGFGATGGGVAVSGGTLAIENSLVTMNTTSGENASGGGFSQLDGNTSVRGSRIIDNRTAGQGARGGGGFVQDGVILSNSIVRGNRTSGIDAQGGGLYLNLNADNAVLENMTIADNTTSGAGAVAGGLFLFNGDSIVTGSTISGNLTTGGSAVGGGIFASFTGTMHIVNSSISGNRSKAASGGGMYVANSGSSVLTHVTVAGNVSDTADSDGLLVTPAGNLTLNNSLVVQFGSGDVACGSPAGNTVNSLATDASCGTGVDMAANIALQPLAFNGGPTQTHALGNGSVAIDAAPDDALCGDMPPAGAGEEDQRGVPRPLPIAGLCDIGAYEVGANLDLGDAPDADPQDAATTPPLSYPTLLANNGAAHVVFGGAPVLGVFIDFDEDGQPTVDADGDDLDNFADEDGVFFTSVIEAGANATLDVTVLNGPAQLNAWMDFNADGDWDDAGEQIFINEMLMDGSNAGLVFAVPASAMAGESFARFRLNLGGNLTPGGLASVGEVEDYRVFIGPEPTVMFNDAENNPLINEKAGTFTISDAVLLSNPSSQEITVEIMFDAGASDAMIPDDFDFAPMTVTFAPGETRADIEMMIVNDDIDEPDEVAVFNLANPVNATLGIPSTFTATLKDTTGGGGGGSGSSGCSMGDGKSRLDPVLSLLVLLAAGWLVVGWLTRRNAGRTKPWK